MVNQNRMNMKRYYFCTKKSTTDLCTSNSG